VLRADFRRHTPANDVEHLLWNYWWPQQVEQSLSRNPVKGIFQVVSDPMPSRITLCNQDGLGQRMGDAQSWPEAK